MNSGADHSTTEHDGLPLISVVLPFYKQTEYLEEAVSSVLKAASGRLELILINDGTPDQAAAAKAVSGAAALCREAKKTFKLIQTENRGLSSALNSGFGQSCGAYLTWTSADNLFEPGALDKLARFLRLNPELDLVYADVRLIDSLGRPLQASNYRTADQLPSDRSILHLPADPLALPHFPDNFINSCFLFRRRSYLATGSHRPELLGFEDYDYWLRLSTFGRCAHLSPDHLLAPLYNYRLHPQSLTAALSQADLAEKTSERQAAAKSRALRLSGDLTVTCRGGPERGRPLERLFNGSGVNFSAETGGDLSANLELQLYCRLTGEPRPGKKFGTSAVGEIRQHAEHDAAGAIGTIVAPSINQPFTVFNFRSEERISCSMPLEPDTALYRARDSCFGAVIPAEKSLSTLLLLIPQLPPQGVDAYCSKVAGLIARFSAPAAPGRATFVLAAACAKTRATADAVNLRLADNSLLRIIDLTDRAKERDKLCQSLIYLLGSVDAILNLERTNTVLLATELVLGAAALRPVISASSDQPALNCDNLALEDSPHIISACPGPDMDRKLLTPFRPSRSACDQWLNTVSTQAAGAQILALMCRN